MCLKAKADVCILLERKLNTVTRWATSRRYGAWEAICIPLALLRRLEIPNWNYKLHKSPRLSIAMAPNIRRNELREIDLIDARAQSDVFWYIPGEHTWLHNPRIPFNWLTLLINRFDEVHDQNCAFYLPSHRRRTICNTMKKAMMLLKYKSLFIAH